LGLRYKITVFREVVEKKVTMEKQAFFGILIIIFYFLGFK